MKSKIFLSAIVLLFLSFILVQCSKEKINDTNSSNLLTDNKVELRSDECELVPCGAFIIDTIYDITLPESYPDCDVSARIKYAVCNRYRLEFYDFELIIPEECDSLLDWLESLSTDDEVDALYRISAFAQEIAQFRIIQNHIDNHPGTGVYKATTYKGLCVQMCKWLDPECLCLKIQRPPNTDDISVGPRGRDRTNCLRTRFLRCGTGCCLVDCHYIVVNGVAVQDSREVSSFGDCTPLSEGIEDNWGLFGFGPCGQISYLVGDCETRCE